MKLKTTFVCEKCGYTTSKWLGRCTSCDAWNSFYEEVVAKDDAKKVEALPREVSSLLQSGPAKDRLTTGIQELDRVLGGGIVEGSMILLSGEPGIGKSTLTLTLCGNLAPKRKNILYISGEESQQQVSLRAQRLNIRNENILFLAETNFENILATLETLNADFIIIDSIQVIASGVLPSLAGSINQVRFCTESLMNFAKKNNIDMEEVEDKLLVI